MVAATQLTEPCTHHGEGPFWDAPRDRLLFVDMLAGAVMSRTLDGTLGRHRVGSVAAVVRARAAGGFVLALERGFAFADADLRVVETLPEVVADPGIRMNDGGCDPQGRFYCGTMAYAMTPGAGTLYRLGVDRRVEPVLTGVTISNGLQWSRDGSTAFYCDSGTGRIDAFDVDPVSGSLSARRPFAAIDGATGVPDGLAIDEEDGVWVALWGGSAVHRYDARGILTEVVELPVPKVTACAFGDPDGRTLYITTSREGIERGDHPGSGAVFSVRTGVRGAAPHAFAG